MILIDPPARGGPRPAVVAPGQRRLLRRAARVRARGRHPRARLRPRPLRRAGRVVRPRWSAPVRRRSPPASWSTGWSRPGCAAARPVATRLADVPLDSLMDSCSCPVRREASGSVTQEVPSPAEPLQLGRHVRRAPVPPRAERAGRVWNRVGLRQQVAQHGARGPAAKTASGTAGRTPGVRRGVLVVALGRRGQDRQVGVAELPARPGRRRPGRWVAVSRTSRATSPARLAAAARARPRRAERSSSPACRRRTPRRGTTPPAAPTVGRAQARSSSRSSTSARWRVSW